MKQRTNKYIVLPALVMMLLAVLGSCKKFLAEEQVSNLTQDYYNSEPGLNSLVNGLYIYARVKHEWDGNGAKLIEPETDAYQHTDFNFSRMNSDQYGTNTSNIAGNMNNYIGAFNTATTAPMGAYPHINNCNIALDVIDNVKPGKFGTDETYRNQRRGEILMLRSWAYYLISNQLGSVPLLLEPKREDNGIYYYPKASLEDIYKQIIGDTRFAFENLPPTSTERGRVTKWAAGHLLAKLYLNRAQAAQWQGSGETHLKMLYKGNVATDLDSSVFYATAVINGIGPNKLATDYWTLFNPATSETSPSEEVIWSAQFDINLSLNGRFGGNRSCNYHTGNYTEQSGVRRAMAYGRPFGTYKPSDWGYDNFKDKVNDSRYYKSFMYEYIGNGAVSYAWTDLSAAWWNANNDTTGEPDAAKVNNTWPARVQQGKRAIIYIENQKEEALDSTAVMSQPYQFFARWVRSAVTNKYYYRLFIDGNTMGLATNRRNVYLSSKKYVDPNRGGGPAESNFDREDGTRDAILMRLAETFLIRAEANGRKGLYNLAIDDINVVRRRAGYKSGESRPWVLVNWEPQKTLLAPSERVVPYAADGSAINKMNITENVFTPGTPEALAEGYIPTVGNKADMFIHYIYNEKAREFISEGIAWEDLHNAGILYDRVIYNNQMASNLTGRWPVADNASDAGQNGNGKGAMKKEFTFRPWPNAYLIQLTDENGVLLDENAKKAYQNPGY